MSTNVIYLAQNQKVYDPGYTIIPKNAPREMELTTTFEDMLKKEVLTEKDILTLSKLFDKKLADFDKNIVDIAFFISKLYRSTNFRFNGLDDAVDTLPKEKQRPVLDYLLKNYEHVNRDTGPIPASLLALIPKEHQDTFTNSWNNVTPADRMKTELYYACLEKIRPIIISNIQKLPEGTTADLSFLTPATRKAGTSGEYGSIAPNYTKTDFIELNKTIKYLSSPNDPVGCISLTLLYINACTTYEFDRTTSSAESLIKTKKGECMEAARLYYAVLRAQNKNIPEMYYYFSEVRGHAFGGFKYQDMYYFFDDSKISSGNYFTPTLKDHLGPHIKDNDELRRLDPSFDFELDFPNSPHIRSKRVKLSEVETIRP